MTTSVSTRLHITPLDANLLPIVLGPRLTKVAENISFQSVQTFPENDYGFVDIPEPDANALITKLNGAILKGRKMKVEKARSKKRSHESLQQDNASDLEKPQKKAKKSRKDTDKETGVINGYQISSDRKVKRGWTEPKSDERNRPKSKSKGKTKKSKRQTPSQYTEKEELLFRTELPPNKQSLNLPTKSKSKSKDKKKRDTSTVVHEFERNEIQPAFVRDTASSGQAAEYVDNLGWVDEKGHVVENVPSSLSRRNPTSAERQSIATAPPEGAKSLSTKDHSAEIASPVSTSESASDDNDQGTEPNPELTGDSSVSSSASEVDLDSEAGIDHEEASRDAQSTSQENEPAALQTPQKVHPLEALFKRPNPPNGQEAAKPSLEIETSFSFFDQATTDVDDDLPAMPTTPFTSNDMRSRGVRSAAPTPDTAHPSRFTGFASLMASRPSTEQSQGAALLDTEGNDQSVPASEQTDARTQSDFEKRFWAERGQNNRAWKARRKTALKEQRQKENRLRRPRNW